MEILLVVRNNSLINKHYNLLFNIVREKDKIIKIKDNDAKYNTLISKLLLHYYFQKNYNISNFKIQRTRYNKPYIKNSNIHFNISHSKDLIVLAVNNSSIGIDVENITIFNYDIIKKFFSIKEEEYINSFSNNEKKKHEFFKLWTQKESFIKCIGKGFYHNILDTNMVFNQQKINKKNYNN